MKKLNKDHNDKIEFDEFVQGLGHFLLQGRKSDNQDERGLLEISNQEYSSRGQGSGEFLPSLMM
jgi:hypothetical protein